MAKKTAKKTKTAPKKPHINTPTTGVGTLAAKAIQREGEAVRLRLEGRTLDEIATQLGYSDKSGARLAILRGMNRLSPPENLESLRTVEVAKTYEVEHEAWEQWYRSTENAVKETVKEELIDAGDDDPDGGDNIQKEKTVTTEGQSGNPSLLGTILKAMERRAKLLGLDAPEKIDFNAKTAVRVIGQNPVDVLEKAVRRARGEKVDAVGE